MPEPEKVARYYDEWNERYKTVYGDVIQAYRSADIKEVLDVTLASLQLKDGMKLIDAGCGFGAPSVYFAQNVNVQIDALTISPAQVKEAAAKVAANQMQNRITVHEGDYHQMGKLFKTGNYDGIFFLESLGHSNDLDEVLKGAWTVLKPGGFIYIKDFFYKETNNPEFNKRVRVVVEKVNENYCYNVLSLIQLLKTLRTYGFTIEFIRPPAFIHDIEVRKKFEDDYGLDNFGGIEEFYYSEWLEIKCTKSPY